MAWYPTNTGGKSIPSNVFSGNFVANNTTANTWVAYTLTGTVNNPTDTALGTMLDPSVAHITNGNVVIDKALPKAYLSGVVYPGRTSSGTQVYSGVRLKKNGTEISGASITGNSTTPSPTFRRVQTSFAVGDTITLETRASTANTSAARVMVNIVTDD